LRRILPEITNAVIAAVTAAVATMINMMYSIVILNEMKEPQILNFFNLAYNVGRLMFRDLATIERFPPNLVNAARIAFSSVSSSVSLPCMAASSRTVLVCVSSMSDADMVSPSERMTAF
jgi:hypothetical protein